MRMFGEGEGEAQKAERRTKTKGVGGCRSFFDLRFAIIVLRFLIVLIGTKSLNPASVSIPPS